MLAIVLQFKLVGDTLRPITILRSLEFRREYDHVVQMIDGLIRMRSEPVHLVENLLHVATLNEQDIRVRQEIEEHSDVMTHFIITVK